MTAKSLAHTLPDGLFEYASVPPQFQKAPAVFIPSQSNRAAPPQGRLETEQLLLRPF